MRVPYNVVMEMSEQEAEGWIEAWMELNGPAKKKVYKVAGRENRRK